MTAIFPIETVDMMDLAANPNCCAPPINTNKPEIVSFCHVEVDPNDDRKNHDCRLVHSFTREWGTLAVLNCCSQRP